MSKSKKEFENNVKEVLDTVHSMKSQVHSMKLQVARIVLLMRILRENLSLIREIRVIRDNPRFRQLTHLLILPILKSYKS